MSLTKHERHMIFSFMSDMHIVSFRATIFSLDFVPTHVKYEVIVFFDLNDKSFQSKISKSFLKMSRWEMLFGESLVWVLWQGALKGHIKEIKSIFSASEKLSKTTLQSCK